jgi:hypothetical protein
MVCAIFQFLVCLFFLFPTLIVIPFFVLRWVHFSPRFSLLVSAALPSPFIVLAFPALSLLSLSFHIFDFRLLAPNTVYSPSTHRRSRLPHPLHRAQAGRSPSADRLYRDPPALERVEWVFRESNRAIGEDASNPGWDGDRGNASDYAGSDYGVEEREEE